MGSTLGALFAEERVDLRLYVMSGLWERSWGPLVLHIGARLSCLLWGLAGPGGVAHVDHSSTFLRSGRVVIFPPRVSYVSTLMTVKVEEH